VVDGTRGGASDGMLEFTYTNATGILKTMGGDLHAYDVSGCFGLIANGDPIKVTIKLKLSPRQTMTSP
jgi:hypothetical protein